MATGVGNKLTGQVGEHLVSAVLGTLGYYASPYSGNVPGFDVTAVHSDSLNSFPVQVKISTKGGASPHNGPDTIENFLCLSPNMHVLPRFARQRRAACAATIFCCWGLAFSHPGNWLISIWIPRPSPTIYLQVAGERGARYPCPTCGALCPAHDFQEKRWWYLNSFIGRLRPTPLNYDK